MKKEHVDIGELIDKETERRLAIMESPDYEWPPKAGKGDVIAIIIIMLICLMLILGCVLEVIV